MDIQTIVITTITTLVVTIIAGIAVEYFKKIKPKLEYSIKEAIPIELDGKIIGANVVQIENPSSNPVKEIVLKIKSEGVSIKNGGVKSTTGLDYSVIEDGDTLQITIPFLKYKDYLSITSIVEGRYSIPKNPNVTVRSPDSYTLINTKDAKDGSRGFLSSISQSRVLVPATIAAATVSFSLGFGGGASHFGVRSDQGTNLAIAAAVAGLPQLAHDYKSNSGIYYYNQGPYIYSIAKASKSKEEVAKLKLFLVETTKISEKMSEESRASIFGSSSYSL